MVGLHATDQSSVVLSAWARVSGFAVDDLDRALYDERTIVKQLAMRRTLFVLPRATLPVAVAAAGPRVVREGRRGLVRDIQRAGVTADGDAWVASAEEAVLDALADADELTTSELGGAVPLVGGSTASGNGRWAANVAILPRLLAILSARGLVVRSRHHGAWMNARPSWSRMDRWLGAPLPELDPDEARAELVSRWLHAFGPGTDADIAWWLGGSLGEVRAALGRVRAVAVELEGTAKPGWLLARRSRRARATGAVGRAPAHAGPHDHGLEGPRLVPRAASVADLRQRRERRDDGMVGRAHRRRLVPAIGREG